MATINATNTSNPITVDQGGTGAVTQTIHGVLLGQTTSAITATTAGTNGQCLLGSTGADPVFATLTSTGGTVTFTTGAGTLNLETATAGTVWSVITADQTAAVDGGYICNKGSALLLALPTTSAAGATLEVTGINTALGWKITQAAGQQIFFGTSSSTSGATGFIQSSNIRDSVKMVCVVANLTWNVISSVGNITISQGDTMASTNNALNNASSTSVASTTQTFVVSNSDNTGTSAAQLQVSVGGGTTSGDPQTSYIITGATTWSVGVDNSVSDQFVIATSATLGTSNAQTISTTGVVSWPLQPTFLVFLPTNDTNKTGTGTVFTFGSATALTKVFDIGTNITTAGVFTAPTTGQYYLTGNIELSNCTINSGIQIQFVTTARTYQNRFNRTAANTTNAVSLATIADMTAGDTATMTVAGFGEAGDTNTVDGTGGGLICYYGGFLMG